MLRLTRSEKKMIVRTRLFEAAVRVVGEVGYADASIARITKYAGVSQGTFYNHFSNRQQLLDQLLPTVGSQMLEHIAEQSQKSPPGAEKEVARFYAFFDFLANVPEFLRILDEAAMFAPLGYSNHMENVASAYTRTLQRAQERGFLYEFTDVELEVVVHILLGARYYLSRVYLHGDQTEVRELPDAVISAYKKLMTNGLFRRSEQGPEEMPIASDALRPAPKPKRTAKEMPLQAK